MTGEILLQIVMAMIGALGFGLLFHISGSRLITIMLGAAVNWGVYLLAMQWYDNRVTAFFVATLATAALDEVLARLLKAPVITLLVPMLVPLIPGGEEIFELAHELGAYAVYISGAGPTIMAVVHRDNEDFFAQAEEAMTQDDKMIAFSLRRLLADNTGAVVE